ncbi:hypothetical protein IIF7_06896 [Zunongwangia atlantica 22II14-10F7]|uniref:Uncharacterized protein n=2 Tax=Zunongwangia TaxID=417127 RepID=A0A1Y1T5G1_9FLAO|nr:hypothetical protein IIF7_06896 [Zunongwangia atlantica 22II14-10F7]
MEKMKKKSMILSGMISVLVTILILSFRTKNPEYDIFKYQIIDTWNLPPQLKNTTGISKIDKERIACITKNEGSLFIYNIKTKSIENKIEFGHSTNYTDLEIIENTAYILKKEGILIRLKNYKNKPEINEYQLFNDSIRNATGLTYDAKTNRLIIAVKNDKFQHKGRKGVYAFSMTTKQIDFNAEYEIELKSELFSERKNEESAYRFLPNAISKDADGNLHILDTKHHEVLKVSANNKKPTLYKMSRHDFPHPETISSLENGNFLILDTAEKPKIIELKLK